MRPQQVLPWEGANKDTTLSTTNGGQCVEANYLSILSVYFSGTGTQLLKSYRHLITGWHCSRHHQSCLGSGDSTCVIGLTVNVLSMILEQQT